MKRTSFVFFGCLLILGCGGDNGTGHSGFFGKSLRQLTASGGNSPSWSPDGSTIVYAANQDLWIISPEGGEPERLTSMLGAEGSPVWHPDSDRREVVFVNNLNFQKYTVYIIDVASRELREVISITQSISYPSFTNDGSKVAYAVGLQGQGIFLAPAAGGQPSRIENIQGWRLVTAARCSPTSPVIAYVENRSDDYNIFLMSLSGNQPINLTGYRNTAGDVNKVWHVDWSKNGRELVFTRSANPYGYTSAIFTISAEGGEPVAWTEDPIGSYIEYAGPSYSPDGNRLAVSHGSEIWILQLR